MGKFVFRELQPQHANQMLLLQNSEANPEFFARRNNQSLISACETDRCIGLFDRNENLVAYSIFTFATNIDKDYANLPVASKVGRFAGSVVSKEHKGKGIQRYFLTSHVSYAIANNFDAIISYAHPLNKSSVKNIKLAGLSSMGIRYLHHREKKREVFLRKITNY